MTTKCPSCGTTIERDLPVVSLETNEIAFNGSLIKVEPQLAELLAMLVEDWPRTSHRERITRGLWGFAAPPKRADVAIRVRMMQLRAVIFQIGFNIKADRLLGYRLEKAS